MMSTVLQSAAESRKAAERFNMSSYEVFRDICDSVKIHSERGQLSVTHSFLKSAITKEDLEAVLAEVESKGYKVVMHPDSADSWRFVVSW